MSTSTFRFYVTFVLFSLYLNCSTVLSFNIIHDYGNLRLVGPDDNSDCGEGRVEFYDDNSARWGMYGDCGGYMYSSDLLDFADSVCQTLGFSYAVSYYEGQTAYLNANPISDTTTWTTSYEDYNYDYISSCYSTTSEMCYDCHLTNYEYCSGYYESTILSDYAIYVKCYGQSSMSYNCAYYSSYDDFSLSGMDGCECEYGSYYCDSDTDSLSTGSWVYTIVVWIVICFVLVACCSACQYRRYNYGYYGWGGSRWGGSYGWFGRGPYGSSPAFNAGYNAGAGAAQQQPPVTTTSTTVVVQPQAQAQTVQQPVMMMAQQPVQYVQQPPQYGQQPVQYIQQPQMVQMPQGQVMMQPMQMQPMQMQPQPMGQPVQASAPPSNW